MEIQFVLLKTSFVCIPVLPPYSKNGAKGTLIEPFKLFQVPPVDGPGFTTIEE